VQSVVCSVGSPACRSAPRVPHGNGEAVSSLARRLPDPSKLNAGATRPSRALSEFAQFVALALAFRTRGAFNRSGRRSLENGW
jgi:hypothetical protein